MSRSKFLQRVSLEEARDTIRSLARLTPAESVTAEDSHARVTAEAVYAAAPSPAYCGSAMDGIAVRADDTASAAADRPLVLLAGAAASRAPGSPVCQPVDTGNPLPGWADAVIRIEDVEAVDAGFRIRAPIASGRNVRNVGEDVAQGALLFGRGHRIRPYDIGAMLATGVMRVAVRKPPSVAVIATGTEVVEPGAASKPGQVIEFNSRMLAAYVREWGGEVAYLGRVADDPTAMGGKLVGAAAGYDAVCVIAGSSVGRKDFTVEVLQECGEILVHGVDVMPGKPASIARIGDTPVIGIPGYPVSAAVVYMELVAPLVAAMLGTATQERPKVDAVTRRKIASRLGVEEFLRVCLAHDGTDLVVAPLPRGAGSITTLVRADALLRIPATCEGLDRDTRVRVELLPASGVLGDTVVVAGFPDPISAAIEDRLRSRGKLLRFAYLGLADYDCMAALRNGEAHMAVFRCDTSERRAELDELERSYLPQALRFSEAGATASSRHRILASASFASSPNGSVVLAELAPGGN